MENGPLIGPVTFAPLEQSVTHWRRVAKPPNAKCRGLFSNSLHCDQYWTDVAKPARRQKPSSRVRSLVYHTRWKGLRHSTYRATQEREVKSIRNQVGIISESSWDDSGIMSESFWDNFAIILGLV